MRRGVAIVFLGVGLAGVAGCASWGELDSGPVYPLASQRVETLDVHAFREGTRLRLTNTTARRFGPSVLWLNGRYGYAIEGLDIGETLRVPLGEFVDAQGRRFGAGGFFAAEPPELLALVELTLDAPADEQPVKYGLVAVGQRR